MYIHRDNLIHRVNLDTNFFQLQLFQSVQIYPIAVPSATLLLLHILINPD